MKLLLLVGIGALLAVQAQAASVRQFPDCPAGTYLCDKGRTCCNVKGRELDNLESATREEALIQKILDLTDSLKREASVRSCPSDPADCEAYVITDLAKCRAMGTYESMSCACTCKELGAWDKASLESKSKGGSRYGCSIYDDPAWCQTADLGRCGTMHPVDAECGCHCHLVQEHQ